MKRLAFIVLVILCVTNQSKPEQARYGMVIDAGSTHSQLFIYRFSCNSNPKLLPIQITFSEAIDPISNLQSQLECNTLVSSLIEFATTYLKDHRDDWEKFPIYLKATAGMRILKDLKKQQILKWIHNSFANIDLNPFLYDDNLNDIIISGQEESMFDWFAVNLLYNNLKNHDTIYDVSDQFIPNTLGILDLGGESTEIAFMTSDGLLANSFLGYGTVGIEQKIAQYVFQQTNNNINTVTYNPCLNNGYIQSYIVNINGKEIENVQFGSSSLDMCSQVIANLISSLNVNGLSQEMKFVALSAFGYNYDDLGAPGNMNLNQLYDMMVDICDMSFEQLKQSKWNNKNMDAKYLNKLCLLNNYIYVLLHEVYGFDLNNQNFEWTNEHNQHMITWTQGFILTYLNENRFKYCVSDYNMVNMINMVNTHEENSDYLHLVIDTHPLYFIIAFIFVACLYVITSCMVMEKVKENMQYNNTIVQDKDTKIKIRILCNL